MSKSWLGSMRPEPLSDRTTHDDTWADRLPGVPEHEWSDSKWLPIEPDYSARGKAVVPPDDLNDSFYSRQLQKNSMTPKDQALAIAMNIARRAERASGGRVGYADGGEPSEGDLPMPDAKMARAISDRAMRGLDPTPEQQAYLERIKGIKEERSKGLGEFGTEITGIPGLVRGATKAVKPDADALTRAAGVGEVGLSALPFSPLARGALPALNAVTKSAPRMFLTGMGLAAPGAIDEARASEKSAQTKLADIKAPDYLTKELEALRTERAAVMKEYTAMNERHRYSGPETQRKALAPLEQRMQGIEAKIGEAEGRVRDFMKSATDAARKELPFRERHPGAAETISGGAVALGTALPFASTLKNRIGNFVESKLINRAARHADEIDDPIRFTEAQKGLNRRIDKLDSAHGVPNNAWDFGKAAALSGLLQYEAAAAPELVDALSFSPGHPTRDTALHALSDPDYYKARIIPSALWGLGTAGIGSKIGHLITPEGKISEHARGVAARGGPESFADAERFARFQNAIDAIRTGQNAPAKAPGTLEGGRLHESGLDTSRTLQQMQSHQPRSQELLPSPAGERLSDRVRAQRQSPDFEPIANPPSAAPATPEKVYVPVPVRVSQTGRVNYAAGVPDELGVVAGRFAKAEHRPQSKKPVPQSKKPEKAEKKPESIQADEIPQKPDLPLEGDNVLSRGRSRGGLVGRALAIARNMGGRVHVGPITQRNDGGRTDTVPMDVAPGSHVIPADIVSHLGQGDTNAGYGVCREVFGDEIARADGGAIPIMAAGGEFVVGPDAVAKWGKGNPQAGHDAIDQWIKMERRKAIQTLKKLPPPARD